MNRGNAAPTERKIVQTSTSNSVPATQFHSMRGHVAEGTRVTFSSKPALTLCSSMRGWRLVSDDAAEILGPFDGAMAVTAAIVEREVA